MDKVGSIRFEKPVIHNGSLVTSDQQGRFFLKAQLFQDPNKSNSMAEEAKIFEHLNETGAVTCPRLHHRGSMPLSQIHQMMGGSISATDGTPINDPCPFLILQFIPEARAVRLVDLLLAIIEQKNLGVYHGDPKPEHCRFDPATDILYLVDYDQAELLDEDTRSLNNLDFLHWCNEYARRKYELASMFHYFPGIDLDHHALALFRDGALDIGGSSLLQGQQTTLGQSGVYHRIAETDVVADGERDLEARRPLLDTIPFRDGERVLDVGCNTGLLSRYLFDRGCRVTGIELDTHAVNAARIISNIAHKPIEFRALDLDKSPIPGSFDTIMLFSVLHHTQDPPGNAKKLAAACRRFIIECRLVETGAKPIGDAWHTTSKWQFGTVEEMSAFLETLFPGFRLSRNYGQGDRGRYVLEFLNERAPIAVGGADGEPATDEERARILDRQGCHDDAAEAWRRAVDRRPDDLKLRFSYALALGRAKRRHDSIAEYERILEREPAYIPALINLADLVAQEGQQQRSIEIYERALEVKPDLAAVHSNLGNIYKGMGRAEESLAHYRRAVEIDPAFSHGQSNLLFASHYVPAVEPLDLYQEHVQRGRIIAGGAEVPAAPACDRTVDRPLRVGYLSPDFRTHPVGFFIEPILAHHDTKRVTTFAYHNSGSPDETTARLKNMVAEWRDVRPLGDAELVDLIRGDRIDILVELSGHTANNRLPAVAQRPAPVQVTYLGYPDTTGIPAVDYRLTDRWADPPGEADDLATETLVRLPDGFLCYQPPADLPDLVPPPARTVGHVTFASFNNIAKTHPLVIEAWARILDAVPESRLLLKSRAFENLDIRTYFSEQFTGHGISLDRVALVGATATIFEHLALYNEVDIALDTFPYNGTTTTCEALVMGVPVITLAGRSHVGRVGVSLLSSRGVTDTIASDTNDYVARAIELAGNLDRLAQRRQTLRRDFMAAPASDPARFTRGLEAAYTAMWRQFCSRPR
ncbi:MAG: tetratricopeptide repeat protein [Alphaproteobacteria bacterium]|nr:tetratricopeptide repeat protein [Alphaproteobacteria bacterium]